LQLDIGIYDADDDGAPLQEPEARCQEPEAEEEEDITRFSDMCNPDGFNCQILSWHAINRIDMTDFQRQRPLQKAKMRAIKSRAWKIN